MKKQIVALLAGAMLMAATSAMALPVYSPASGAGTSALWLHSGTSDVVVYDNDADGMIIFNGLVGTQLIDVSVGQSKPNIGSATLPSLSLNNTIVSGSGTLEIRYTDLYFGPVSSAMGGFSLHGGGTLSNATTSVSVLISESNTAWAGSNLIDLGSFTTSSFSKDLAVDYSGSGPFSLTLDTLITVGDRGTAQVASLLQPVPEPGTMMLFGFGMFGLAIYGKRRMNKEA
jgi:hypothetical protein